MVSLKRLMRAEPKEGESSNLQSSETKQVTPVATPPPKKAKKSGSSQRPPLPPSPGHQKEKTPESADMSENAVLTRMEAKIDSMLKLQHSQQQTIDNTMVAMQNALNAVGNELNAHADLFKAIITDLGKFDFTSQTVLRYLAAEHEVLHSNLLKQFRSMAVFPPFPMQIFEKEKPEKAATQGPKAKSTASVKQPVDRKAESLLKQPAIPKRKRSRSAEQDQPEPIQVIAAEEEEEEFSRDSTPEWEEVPKDAAAGPDAATNSNKD